MPINPTHIAAKRVLDFYIEQLEQDETEESNWALQCLNLKMAKYKCNSYLDMLYSYPITVEDDD